MSNPDCSEDFSILSMTLIVPAEKFANWLKSRAKGCVRVSWLTVLIQMAYFIMLVCFFNGTTIAQNDFDGDGLRDVVFVDVGGDLRLHWLSEDLRRTVGS